MQVWYRAGDRQTPHPTRLLPDQPEYPPPCRAAFLKPPLRMSRSIFDRTTSARSVDNSICAAHTSILLAPSRVPSGSALIKLKIYFTSTSHVTASAATPRPTLKPNHFQFKSAVHRSHVARPHPLQFLPEFKRSATDSFSGAGLKRSLSSAHD